MPKKSASEKLGKKFSIYHFFKVAFQVGENSAKITLGPINIVVWPGDHTFLREVNF